MAAIHAALQSLSPTAFAAVPTATPDLASYLDNTFADASLLVDSVPPPPDPSTTRPRSASAVSLSSSRSAPATPERVALQSAWGKPLKLSAKDNPLAMHVYKLAGADGRGAWFARRSVHEGLGFAAWRDGLRTEFPLGWSGGGGDGDGGGGSDDGTGGSGIVRSMKGERLVEDNVVKGVGKMEVFHVSAQFPGPAARRDFVTLLLTRTGQARRGGPRSFVMVSKPCEHETCPPKNGVVRGQYESVEFIREVPRGNKKTASAVSLPAMDTGAEDSPLKKSVSSPPPGEEKGAGETRRARGKSVSFAGPAHDSSADEDGASDTPAVEWIQITRSDPGGSVPRFLVDRGTPGGICADAVKFVEWASKREAPDLDGAEDFDDLVVEDASPDSQPTEHVNGAHHTDANSLLKPSDAAAATPRPQAPSTFLQAASSAAASTIEAYAPRSLSQRLVSQPSSTGLASPTSPASSSRSPSISSSGSFASAEDFASPAPSIKSGTSGTSAAKKASTPEDAAVARLAKKRAELDAKLQKAREREGKESQGNKEKEAARRQKAEEKHKSEMERAEAAHVKELKDLKEKKEREEKRRVEKEEKAQEKARKKEEQAREKREREDVKRQLEIARKEAEVLKKENERLVGENERLERENQELKEAAKPREQEIPVKN